MQRILPLALTTLLFAAMALAATIDGKWAAELRQPAGKKGGEPRTIQLVLDLKSDGSALSGTAGIAGRPRATVAIQNGKIEANRFSFTTLQKTRNGGESKFNWQGTIENDQLQGTRTREGARRGMPFIAKRQ